MLVYVFGKTKLHPVFSQLQRRDVAIEFFPIGEMKKKVKSISAGSIVYVDIAGCDASQIESTIKILEKQPHVLWGIIDERDFIKDPAELFHRGAADYIGKLISKLPITKSRLKKIALFKKIDISREIQKNNTYICLPSGDDWETVKEGKEYTFCMMFFELDHQSQIKKNASEQQIKERSQTVHNFLEKILKPLNGKVWMWWGFGGLILFPFNGKNCDAILAAVRMNINRAILSVEECKLGLKLSFRIVLHIGNTVYRNRGNTGTVISDAINSVFHLGQKFAKSGDLLLTQEVEPFILQGIKDLFVAAGTFEGRKVYKFAI